MARLSPENRRAVIVTAAVKIARERGLARVTHGDVATRCVLDTSKRLVRHYFPTQVDLWNAVVEADAGFAEQARGLGL